MPVFLDRSIGCVFNAVDWQLLAFLRQWLLMTDPWQSAMTMADERPSDRTFTRITTKFLRRDLLAFMILGGLAACGRRGSLESPSAQPPIEPPVETERDDEGEPGQ